MLEEHDKPEEKLKISASELYNYSLVANISTMFDKASELLQKDSLVIKKISANDDCYIVAEEIQIKPFEPNLVKEVPRNVDEAVLLAPQKHVSTY